MPSRAIGKGRITGARISPWTIRSIRSLTGAGRSATFDGAPGRPPGGMPFFDIAFAKEAFVDSLLVLTALAVFTPLLPETLTAAEAVSCVAAPGGLFVAVARVLELSELVTVTSAATELVLCFAECSATELVDTELVPPFAIAFVPGALVSALAEILPEGELVFLAVCASGSWGRDGSAGTVRPRLKVARTINTVS